MLFAIENNWPSRQPLYFLENETPSLFPHPNVKILSDMNFAKFVGLHRSKFLLVICCKLGFIK